MRFIWIVLPREHGQDEPRTNVQTGDQQ